MIHSKNSSGSALIEAMIAIAIMGMVLTPMFLLETNVFNVVARLGEQFHRLIFAHHFLYIAQEQEPVESTTYSLEKKEEKPLSMVRYTLTPIAKQSSLASVERLYRQEVFASGIRGVSPQARLVHFIYKPEPVST